MKVQHTPGPWTVEVSNDETTVESPIQTIATNVSNCDADLIAAAPEMYMALCRMLPENWDAALCEPTLADIEAVRTAIAKAKGE